MKHRTAPHPVFRIVMHDQGRSLVWLARQTGFSHAYVKAVSAGIEKGSPRFRAACARVLGIGVHDLFHAGGDSGGTPDKEAELGRPATARRDGIYRVSEVPSISQPA